MKKMNLKRVISLVLATILLATVAPINTEAAVSSGRTVTVRNPFSSMTFTANTGDTLVDKYSTKAATDYEKELVVNVNYMYTNNDRFGTGSYCGRIFPITVSSGGTLVIESRATMLQKNVYMELYFDPDCTNYVDSYIYGPQLDGPESKDKTQVPMAGTYYLKVESTGGTAFTNIINMDVAFYSSDSMSLAANKVHALGCSSSTRYYKITVPSTTNVTIIANNEFSYSLCNASKKVIYDYVRIRKSTNYRASHRLAKGTYYIKIDHSYADYEYFKIKYTFSSDITLKNGSYSTIYPGSYAQNSYVKIRPTVDGYITITLYKGTNYDDGGYITLMSNGKVISEEEYISATSRYSYKVVFGVKKNTTYYLKVRSLEGKAAIRYIQTKVSEKSGKTKAKAVALKKNKAVNGTIVAGSSEADWYKVKLTKSQKLKLYTTANASGTIKMQLYYSNGKKFVGENTVAYDINQKATHTTWSKLKKGTYYIKIYGSNTKSSGNYSLKW